MKKPNATFVSLFLLALAIRLAWFFSTDNAGNGDAAARLNIVQQWLYSYWLVPGVDYFKILNPSVDWLPLHFYMTGAAGFIVHDLVYAPRLFTLLINVLTLIPLYKICLMRYNRSTANIAVAILALYGMHIYLSGLILSESFYLFFLLWCYYFIEKYRAENKDAKWILLIGLSLFCCCLLRYEAWVFAPLVILIVPFIKKIKTKNFLILSLIPTVAVCFVMVCEVLQGEHPLRGILFSDYEVKQTSHFMGAFDYTDLLPGFLPFVFISTIFLFGQTLKARNKPDILILSLYLLPVLPFIIKLCNGTLTPQARYLVLYMVPAIVLVSGFIHQVFQRFSFGQTARVIFLIAYLIIADFSFAHRIADHKIRLKYEKGFMHSAQYFKDSVSLSKAYIDYGYELSNCNWMVYADLYDAINSEGFVDSAARVLHVDPKPFIERIHKGARYRVTGREVEWKTWKKSGFDDLLRNNDITHVVLFPGGVLSDTLRFSNLHETYMNRQFTRLFGEDGYMIYKIEGANP